MTLNRKLNNKKRAELSRPVFVEDKHGNPLMPTTQQRCNELTDKGKAFFVCFFALTIRLTERIGGDLQALELTFDPGSKTTGIAMVLHGKKKSKVIWAANLEHRGWQIKKELEKRKNARRSRPSRFPRRGKETEKHVQDAEGIFNEAKLPSRKRRFLNRKRQAGWLPPSVISRVDQPWQLGSQTSKQSTVDSYCC
eukprot:TRINITY_DN347_c0_g1_i5.p1 TRINITY_DN347_c0_g1~~TRINITY_DN347_c0_g1_i5.p1  ORF type:complete len:224 (-),score=23.75 TRINITY_DN347_c0_g1_i5:329-913(-)